ncbi:phage tail length tape measure family protein [Lelliottia sp. V89_10]|uniref:phage tail length tape measure family protein n=1 Tax=Lelliottia wanjuensis TaxID=3050585 RepID=UPI00249F4B4D|nr:MULTISPECIES: phage tail length tape measure family protein [unclassified Lelliottia]MDI3359779.1 phage tail length tape measure family protein [Lelliottia sp. V89_13]MDK9548737.1 phage tail length tape measure family protein [Lelliottia sp. V89_5]MDK9597369.1 phage tail length tape measure family protein [Lelliottia sp. V89_10]
MAQSQQVGDLVVNLDVNASKFTEEIVRAEKQLTGLDKTADVATKKVSADFSAMELSAKKAGISVGQYANAMRTLPAQFTDIATQLAGGQSPFMILLQQGGQIKDQFGSVQGALSGAGNYIKSLAGLINPVTIGVTALGAAVTALGMAWYEGAHEQSEFNKQLILTGSYSGKTAGQLAQLSSEIGKETGSIANAAEAVAKVTGTGLFKGETLEKVSRAAVEMQKNTGQAVDQTIAQFKRLQEDPVKASEDLNAQYHYLTASVYDQIAALERENDVVGAAKLATDTYADAMKTRTTQLTQNLGTIETLWLNIKNAAAGAWDQMLNVGRTVAPEQTLESLKTRLASQKEALKQMQGAGPTADYGVGRQSSELVSAGAAQHRKDQEASIKATETQIRLLEQATGLNQDITTSKAKAREDTDKDIKASERHNAYMAQYESNAVKRARELKQLEADRAKYSATDFAMVKKGIEEKYADKKQPAIKTPGGVKALDATSAQTLELESQLKVLQQHTGLSTKISAERKDLWKEEAKFTILEEDSKKRQLTSDEQSLLNNKEQILAGKKRNAELGDQKVLQEQINALMDDSTRYVNQMAEKTKALTLGSGTSTREAKRLMEQAQLQQGWMNKGGKLSDEGFKRELSALQNYYDQEDKMRSDWQSGALRSLQDYADEATNYYKIAADGMSSILGSATNAISQGLNDIVTGSKSVGQAFSDMFAGLGQAVIQTLTKMAAQWIVYKTVQLAVGKTTKAESAGVMSLNAQAASLMAQLNAYSSTAAIPIVGPAKAPIAMATAAAITKPIAATISALSLTGMAHDGIDRVPATGTWLLEKGERVLSSGTSKRLDGAIAQMRGQRAMMAQASISQTFHFNGNPDERMATMFASAAKEGAKQGYDMVVSDLAKGNGKASRVMQSLYTTKRKVR